ncbi:MAG: adenylyltransferase/cytidyltransferase family protein [Rikenellaceae bacterium]
MRLVYGFDELDCSKKTVVTIGSFDGVHLGHREILKTIVKKAKQDNLLSVVMTFSPHPRAVLDADNKGVKLLNTLSEKALLLEELGVDILLVVPFTREFSKLEYEQFLSEYLIKKVNLGCLVIGFNHHFGHNKTGSVNSISSLSKKYNFEVLKMPKMMLDSVKVSSTYVRNLIESIKISEAEECLLRPYFFIAKIDENSRVLLQSHDKLMPPNGEYNVSVEQGSEVFKDTLIVKNYTYSLAQFKNVGSEDDFIIKFV